MIKLKQAALLPPNIDLPGHGMSGQWQLGKWPESFIEIMPLHDLVQHRKTSEIAFADIASKPYKGPNPNDEKSIQRYIKSDPSYPGYIVEMQNPYGKRYRMIDGRRRLHKQTESGKTSGNFYVFQFNEITPFIWHVVRTNNLEQLIDKIK